MRALRARALTRRKSRHREVLARDGERDLEQHYANRARHRRGHIACIHAGTGRMQEEKAGRATAAGTGADDHAALAGSSASRPGRVRAESSATRGTAAGNRARSNSGPKAQNQTPLQKNE